MAVVPIEDLPSSLVPMDDLPTELSNIVPESDYHLMLWKEEWQRR